MINTGRRARGFSLLEVLVAFVVLSLSLGIILQIFSLSSRITRTSEVYQQALLVAESKMAELLSEPFIEPGRDDGSYDDRDHDGVMLDMQWQTEVSDYEFPDDPPVDNQSLQPYLIEVSVSWGDGAKAQNITLSTIRLERQHEEQSL
ncbi:type IV pilus modification PilV family protein [Amphritea sp. HPY]|uniref:type IV pilus modification PilV family protein n=1 Tax=Amphritea sp. HPY TaxID=3421652 RepID=UPI003D7E5E72